MCLLCEVLWLKGLVPLPIVLTSLCPYSGFNLHLFGIMTRRHLAFDAGGVRVWSGIAQLLLVRATRCGRPIHIEWRYRYIGLGRRFNVPNSGCCIRGGPTTLLHAIWRPKMSNRVWPGDFGFVSLATERMCCIGYGPATLGSCHW